MNQVPFQRPEDLPATFGRYRVLKLLGQGGMGAVYLATDTQLDRPVALKIPHFEGDDGSKVLERFQREARAAATILHPNVCPLHEVGEIDGVPYLTMGYIEGKPLSAFVAAKPLQPRQGALLVRKLALALAEAHKRGVIHRDLKPANIMIDRRSEPIIMDFGLARRARAGDARLTQLGTTMGTPAYMPPEQVNGDIDAMGPASDIYSLGVILYELLTGRLPFVGDAMAQLSQVLLDEPLPPSQVRPEVDADLEAICLKAMAKKIPDRYASMTDLAAALQAYLRSKGPAEPLRPLDPNAKTPTPAPTAATLRPRAKANPAFGSPEERDAFLGAPTLKPGFPVRAQGEVRPIADMAAETPSNNTPKKTARDFQFTAIWGGVPLWVWIAGAVAAATAVPVVVVVLLLIFLPKAPDTQVAATTTPTVPAPTNPAPTKPVEIGTIAFVPSEPAPGVELKVDGVAAHFWGDPLQLSVGEHDLEATGKEFMPLQQKFTVLPGKNLTQRVELFRRALAPAKLLVPCDKTGTTELYLMNPDGGAPVQLHESPLGTTILAKGANSDVPTWSPDGKQIAFLASPPGGKHHVYVMNVEDQKVRQMTSWAWDDDCVDWSVDGQLVIGSKQDTKWAIHVMNADGSNQATKLTPDGAEDVYPAWSPDGKKIAFFSKRDGQQQYYGLYLMDADGKNARQIAQINNFRPHLSLAWHPDGKRIAFTEIAGQNTFEIFVIDLDGSSRTQLTRLGGDNHAPAWNPDGKQIAFLHNTTALYLLNVRSTPEYGLLNPEIFHQPEKMLEEKALYRPAWMPRPFLDKPAEYGTIQFEPSEPAPQVQFTVDGVAGYSWGEPLRLTPGDHFWAVSGKGYMPTSDLITVKPGQNPTQRLPLKKLAPDKLLVTCRRNDKLGLYLMNPDGSAPVQLTKLEKSLVVHGSATWSPDGKQIAYVAGPPGGMLNVYTMSVEGPEEAKQLTGGDWRASCVDWSVDGRLVFSSGKDGKSAIWMRKADGSNQLTKLTPADAEDINPVWSPDATKIAFSSKRDRNNGFLLYIMDADGKNPRPITKFDQDPSLSPAAWHPDCKRIAFAEAVGQGIEIFTMDLDGANKKQLTRLGGANGNPAWSPDGKQLAFTHDKMLYVLNINGDEPPRKILEEPAVSRPAWRPRMVVGD